MVCLALMDDILHTLCQLSMAFQQDHVKFSVVMRLLDDTRAALTAEYIDEPFVGGPSYRPLQGVLKGAMAGAPLPMAFPPVPVRYNHRGVADLEVDREVHDWATAGAKQYATDIIQDLNDRFPDVPLFSALQIFDFTVMPEQDEWNKVKASWGDDKLEELIGHFGVAKIGPNQKTHRRVVDPTLVRAQWQTFKHSLYALKSRGLSLDEGYRELLAEDALPDVKRLACFFLVLCLSTVWCERGFSLMAMIKTKLRNCMNIETLDALMQIASNRPEVSDTEAIMELIEEAYQEWLKLQKRCLARSHPGVKHARKHTKKKTVPLHEFLQAQAREAQAAREAFDDSDNEQIEAPEEADDEEGEDLEVDGDASMGGGVGMMDQQTTEEIQSSHGPYNSPLGWTIISLPAATGDAWKEFKSKMKANCAFWRDKKLAHIFNDGWDLGNFQRREKDHLIFHYGSDGLKFAHSLLFKEHGVAKPWVILQNTS